MNKLLKSEWEKRSIELKDTFGSVMFASFPDAINNIFHKWELDILIKHFPKEKKVQILDVGCGYGRLSHPLSQLFLNAFFLGVDISDKYVSMFNKKLKKRGKAIANDLSILPYKKGQIDYIFIVTTFMYLNNPQIRKVVSELKKFMKPNGRLVIIENNKAGDDYITGFGLLPFIKKLMGRKNKHTIESRVFKKNEIETFFKTDFTLLKKMNCSILTVFLPLLFLLGKTGFFKNMNFVIPAGSPFLPSLYNAYVYEKR